MNVFHARIECCSFTTTVPGAAHMSSACTSDAPLMLRNVTNRRGTPLRSLGSTISNQHMTHDSQPPSEEDDENVMAVCVLLNARRRSCALHSSAAGSRGVELACYLCRQAYLAVLCPLSKYDGLVPCCCRIKEASHTGLVTSLWRLSTKLGHRCYMPFVQSNTESSDALSTFERDLHLSFPAPHLPYPKYLLSPSKESASTT